MTSQLLQQVRLLDPVSNSDRVVDVLLENGVIHSIAQSISDYPPNTAVLDCRGLILGPGLVDLYSHSGEPGFEERETLESLVQAAAAGGFTQVVVLPTTAPAIDHPASVSWLHQRTAELQRAANSPLPTQISCWAALTLDAKGQQMAELAELASTEIVGFADGRPISNFLLVKRLLEYSKSLNKPVALWPNDLNLAGSGAMREGLESLHFGLPGIPVMAETSPLAGLLECIAEIGTPVHLMRVSTARGVELIRDAKRRGIPVTASTSWMHLLLNSTAIATYDPNLHLEPPLGNQVDQEALIQAVQDGTLDAIAIDHTPHTYEDKTVAFAESPTGAIGLELALPLLWQALVVTSGWSPLDLWRSLSTNPQKCLRQAPTTVAPGQPARLTLFDPQKPWFVDDQNLRSRSRNTPWIEKEVTGRVVQVWGGDS